MGPKEFHNSIDKKRFQPVYLLYGQEEFLIEQAAKKITSAVLNKDEQSFNLDTFSAQDVDAATIVSSANAFPFMSEHRVVIVKSAEKVFNKAPLPTYIQSPSNQTILILCAGELKQKGKKSAAKNEKSAVKFDVLSYLNEKNAAIQFRAMKDSDAMDWIAERMKERGREISAQASRVLIELKGNSCRELFQEIEKIETALGDKKSVSTEEIFDLVGISKTYNIFELADQVGRRNAIMSQEILNRLLHMGESAIGIVASLTRHFISIWRVKNLMNKKSNKYDLFRQAGFAFEAQWDNIAAQSRQFSARAINHCFEYLLSADLVLKSQPTEEEVVLTRLIHQLVHASD